MRQRPILVLLSAALLAGCSRSSGPAAPGDGPAQARYDSPAEFELAPGQRAIVDGGQFVIRFERVVDDSRCPGDVWCVWAGDARLELRLEGMAEDGGGRVDTLHTTLEPRGARYGAYLVQVVALRPEPRSGDDPGARRYVVRLRADRD